MPELTQSERDAINRVGDAFDAWWEECGEDTSGLSRRALAAMAFTAGVGSIKLN